MVSQQLNFTQVHKLKIAEPSHKREGNTKEKRNNEELTRDDQMPGT